MLSVLVWSIMDSFLLLKVQRINACMTCDLFRFSHMLGNEFPCCFSLLLDKDFKYNFIEIAGANCMSGINSLN